MFLQVAGTAHPFNRSGVGVGYMVDFRDGTTLPARLSENVASFDERVGISPALRFHLLLIREFAVFRSVSPDAGCVARFAVTLIRSPPEISTFTVKALHGSIIHKNVEHG